MGADLFKDGAADDIAAATGVSESRESSVGVELYMNDGAIVGVKMKRGVTQICRVERNEDGVGRAVVVVILERGIDDVVGVVGHGRLNGHEVIVLGVIVQPLVIDGIGVKMDLGAVGIVGIMVEEPGIGRVIQVGRVLIV